MAGSPALAAGPVKATARPAATRTTPTATATRTTPTASTKAPLAGRITGNRGPRVPLLVAGVMMTGSAVLLAGVTATTPDVGLFPRRAWARAVQRAVAAAPDAALDYGDYHGRAELRAALDSTSR